MPSASTAKPKHEPSAGSEKVSSPASQSSIAGRDALGYRFSFGPWNLHEGSDPFGPTVRPTIQFAEKLERYKTLGFDAVQFHDDDAAPNIDGLSASQLEQQVGSVKRMLDSEGLVAEFVAPRLWECPRGIDGGFTANDATCRQWAIDRSQRAIDVANLLGTKMIVLWLAREGTYIRESKNAIRSYERLRDALNAMLEYDSNVEIVLEPKPNEPMDQAYVPTIGHALALAAQTISPQRVGGLIETAHARLAGLDASDEMAFALAAGKLWGVHLNDQNGLKYDQDKAFGSADLRGAYNQVRVLELGGYAASGRYVGLDVKAMRTQTAELAQKHLTNSRAVFLRLVEKVRAFPAALEQELVRSRDYEQLEFEILSHLMNGSSH
jgi:xylose isomerase